MSNWTLITSGFYIDSEGNIYAYTNDSFNTNTLKRFFREAEREQIPYRTSDSIAPT
jgi:hypothetical protein